MNADASYLFHQVTLRLWDEGIDRALENCFTFLKPYLSADCVILSIFDASRIGCRLVAMADAQGGTSLDVFLPLPPEIRQYQLLGDASMKVRIIEDPASNPAASNLARFLRRSDLSCLMMVLALADGRVGGVTFGAFGRQPFTEEHRQLLAELEAPFRMTLSSVAQSRDENKLADLMAERQRREASNAADLPQHPDVIGAEGGLRQVMEQVRQVARVECPVLLLGETGVGKDVVARAIHARSLRSKGPLVKVNCGAIPVSICDSELFGHEKGAYTGAVGQMKGRFERAHGGTIYLDEIGELPLEAQVRLLRVLQYKEIERVGGTQPIPVDIRVIAASNQDLRRMIHESRFREDLWFRLNVYPIEIPPLRRRKGDIPVLARYFLATKARSMGIEPRPLPPSALDQLMAYSWPGNVRELENVIERSLVMHQGGEVSFDHLGGESLVSLAAAEAHSAQTPQRFPSLAEMEALHIIAALERTGGRIDGDRGAARLLGLNASTLRNRMIKLGIPFRHQQRSEHTSPSTP